MHDRLLIAGYVETPDRRSTRGLLWSPSDTVSLADLDREAMHRPALLTGVLVVGATAGCRDAEPTTRLDATLSNARLRTPNGELRFDPLHRPIVRVDSNLRGVAVRFDDDSGTRALVVRREPRSGGALLRVERLSDDSTRGRLCVSHLQAERCWPATWEATSREVVLTEALSDQSADAIGARLSTSSGEDRLWMHIAHSRALRREGRTDDAIQAWHATADWAGRLGYDEESARALRAVAFLELGRGHLDDARRLLAEPRVRGGDPASRRIAEYYAALVDYRLDRLREATRRLQSTRDGAWEAGEDATFYFASDALALVLANQGRIDEAIAIIDDSRLRDLIENRRPLERAAALNNHGWLWLQRFHTSSDAVDLRRAESKCQAALALYGEAVDADLARINLVWIAILGGRLGVAERRAAALDTVDLDAEGALAVGEVHIRAGRVDAANQMFERALREALAVGGGLPTDATWRAQYGLGRVAAARGDTAAALAAWRDALATLDAVAGQTGVWSARARFYADRRPLIEDTARLLIDTGDIDGAFAVLDHAHGSALRALEARARLDRLPGAVRAEWERHQSAYGTARAAFDAGRDDGELLAPAEAARWAVARKALEGEMVAAFEAADALLAREAPRRTPDAVAVEALRAALPADAALVAYATIGEVIHAFWLDRRGVAHAVVTADDLLGPFAARLDAVGHLYVVPGEVPGARDLATVERGGAPLGARLSMSDLPYAALLTRRGELTPGALLVVADPRSDLPHAYAEGRALAAATPGARLIARRAADRDAVRAAMAEAGAMHYAGHGVARAETPWQAHLALADGTTLTVADILTGAVPPGTVVLSGCRTGVQSALSRTEAIGLADAFVAAGARAVLATRENVPDADAARFVARFYAEGGARHPGAALRETAATFAAAGDPIWRAFRLTGDP